MVCLTLLKITTDGFEDLNGFGDSDLSFRIDYDDILSSWHEHLDDWIVIIQ